MAGREALVQDLEELPADVQPGMSYRLSDADLAARLAFFLWGTGPDRELIDVAAQGDLTDDRVLEAQVRRMLTDPRSEALSTRFASQWLRLQEAEKNRKLNDLLDALQFNQVQTEGSATLN